MPASVSIKQAWSVVPVMQPRAAQVEPQAVAPKPLPSSTAPPADGQQPAALLQALLAEKEKIKSFKMHIGASLHIPTRNAKELPVPEQPAAGVEVGAAAADPFEGLPFRGLAERLGGSMLPALEAAREAERQAKLSGRRAAEEAEPFVPPVPHLLPFTRLAASSTEFRSTFIAEPPKDRKKVRLSWYHPDDTMVPRDWFRGGLLADIKYWSPFGLGGN